MATVDTGQLQTQLNGLSVSQPVIIQAGVLQYLINTLATYQPVAVPYYAPFGNTGPVDLTNIPGF